MKCSFLGNQRFLCALIILITCGLCSAAVGSAKPKSEELSISSKCSADLANKLDLKTQDIKLVNIESAVWPNTALGIPEVGKVYAQVQTPGKRLYFQAKGHYFIYTTSDKAFKYGGPLTAWAYSMLYLKPVANEPNLNSDLYQCSLIGTNNMPLASGVSEYYPQENGKIIFTRRTSRSSFDLLYVDAKEPGKEKELYSAFCLGAAAFSRNQDQWAAFVRPRLAYEWTIVVGRTDGDSSKAVTLQLPEDKRPENIAWSGDDLIIMIKDDNGSSVYSTNPAAESPAWKKIGIYDFPGHNKFLLNKSESLEINEIKKDDKPGAEVARVWFTGDKNVVATIADFKMKGYDILGPYAFLWGEKDSRDAAYSVDIGSGLTISAYPGAGTIKPFNYPPYKSPVPAQEKMEELSNKQSGSTE